jgi:capsular polysaccharide biosynthesis protein
MSMSSNRQTMLLAFLCTLAVPLVFKRQTMLLAFLCTLAVPLALARQDPLSYKYNIACDKIIANAQKTAKYHNEHQPVLAAKAEAELFSQFDKAISFKPNEPQAYMSVAQFLSNSHKFDRSIAMWNKVLPLLPTDRPDLRPMIEANIKHCKYGKLSKQRDDVYQQGEGDINAAVVLIEQQLALYYSPRILFDLATLSTMKSELNHSLYNTAHDYYYQAQLASLHAAASFQAVMNMKKRRRPNKKPCPNEIRYHKVGTKTSKAIKGYRSGRMTATHSFDYDVVTSTAYQSKYDNQGTNGNNDNHETNTIYINELQNAKLSGKDGIITKQIKCQLHAFATSEWPVVGVQENLWMAEVWKSNATFNIYDHSLHRTYPPPDPNVNNHQVIEGSALTLVSFSATVYYHWVMNVLPRLIAMVPTLKTSPDMSIIVPQIYEQHNHFVSKTLSLVLDHNELTNALIGYDLSEKPGVRYQVERLYWLDWPVVTTVAGTTHTHCLTSPYSLMEARQHMATVVESDYGGSATKTLLYVGRNGTTTRQLTNEYALVERLQQIVQSNSGWRFQLFDDGKSGVKASYDMFSAASLVVGIHGSGMANILFCAPSTSVIELGFHSIAAEHYKHASLALGLEYYWVGLKKDVHAMGSKTVELEGGMGTVIARVESVVGGGTNEL